MKLIGKGRTADVYYSDGKAIKVYKEGISDSFIAYEYHVNDLAKGFGPKVLNYESSKRQISFEYLEGHVLAEHLKKHPSRVRSIAKIFGKLHKKLHEMDVDLKNQEDYFSEQILRSKVLNDDIKERLIIHLKSLDNISKFCHGDYHLENVILSDQCRIIDWTNAYAGHPYSDIARTYMILSSPTAKKQVPIHLKAIVYHLMKIFKRHYLKAYEVTFKGIRPWLPIVYACRLNEGIDEEKSWLISQVLYEMKKQKI